jgi:hypothetical protein
MRTFASSHRTQADAKEPVSGCWDTESMEILVACYLGFLAVFLIGFMLYRSARGKPALCMLHFFFIGFIIFQLTSGALILTLPNSGESGFAEPARTAPVYAAMITVVLALLAFAYRTRAFTMGIQNKIGTSERSPNSATMMLLAYGAFGFALIFRFVLAFVPILSNLALIIATAMAAASVALGAWAWARNWNNPIFSILFFPLLGAAMAVVIYQNFGRRDLTAVAICAAWGAFHGYFKNVPLRRMALPFFAIAATGVFALAAYTATRTERAASLPFTETVMRLFTADLPKGLLDMASGQEAAGYSMYLIESRPESAPYDTLHSLWFAVTTQVPRQFWPEKPDPLALTLVPELGITKKSPGYNVGPGLIGHISNDNPYIALWLYPLLIGTILRIGDDLIERFPTNPFVVIPVGAGLAEVVAFSRGELGLFLYRTAVCVISVYILLWITAKVLKTLGLRMRDADGNSMNEPTATSTDGVVDPAYADWYGHEDQMNNDGRS